jgi:hypothetical protein
MICVHAIVKVVMPHLDRGDTRPLSVREISPNGVRFVTASLIRRDQNAFLAWLLPVTTPKIHKVPAAQPNRHGWG